MFAKRGFTVQPCNIIYKCVREYTYSIYVQKLYLLQFLILGLQSGMLPNAMKMAATLSALLTRYYSAGSKADGIIFIIYFSVLKLLRYVWETKKNYTLLVSNGECMKVSDCSHTLVRKPRAAITFHVQISRSLIRFHASRSRFTFTFQVHIHVSGSLFTIHIWILAFVISHPSVNSSP